MAALKLITTGGTIGADPYPDPENPPPRSSFVNYGHGKNNLPANCLRSKFRENMSLVELPPVDSNAIKEPYRRRIWQTITTAKEQDAIVTHGTDTILVTAHNLNAYKRKDKRIVLLGAMIPMSNGAHSDSFANLDYAVEVLASGQVPFGASIVLHGFDAHHQWKPMLYRPKEVPHLRKVHAGTRSRLELVR